MMHTRAERKMLPFRQPARGAAARSASLEYSLLRYAHSAWSKRSDDPHGIQIDLLIERDDHVVNACEIKFYSGEFTVDKAYDRILRNRQLLLAKYLSPKISIDPYFLALILWDQERESKAMR